MTYALVERITSDQTFTFNTWVAASFNNEVADPGGFYDISSPTRFTIPSGVSKVKLRGGIAVGAATNAFSLLEAFYKNGSLAYNGVPFAELSNSSVGGGTNALGLFSAPLPVSPGDYFELFVRSSINNATINRIPNDGRNWAAIEDASNSIGALIVRTSTLTPAATDITVGGTIPFQSAVYDDIGAYDSGSPTRLTVPTGVSKIRLVGQHKFGDDTSAAGYSVIILKNGTTSGFTDRPYATRNRNAPGYQDACLQILSPVLNVSPGDYFEMFVIGTDTDLNASQAQQTWFSMEVLETS